MCLIAVDVDGTIDADPTLFGELLQALHDGGMQIAILTGYDTVDEAAIQYKQSYLAELGVDCYDQLVVFDRGNIADEKAAWIEAHDVALLIDNNKQNANAAMGNCMVLVPWATRVKK